MKRILILCLLTLFSITCVFADDPVQLRVAYLPLLPQLPIVVSYENDRLNYSKIDIELIKFKSFTSVEAAIRVGAVHAASIPLPIILSIASDKFDCKVCQIKLVGATHFGGTSMVSKVEGDINVLKGQMIGIPGLDSAEAFSLMAIMDSKGLRFGLDYKAIGVVCETVISDMKNDILDAIYLPEPWGSIAENEAGAHTIENQLFEIKNPTTMIILSTAMLTEHPLAMTEWLESIVNACSFIENDISKTNAMQIAIIQNKYFNISKDIVIQSLTQQKGNLRFKPSLPDMAYLKSTMEQFTELKWIMKSVEFDQLVDTKLFEKAIQKMKK